MSEYDVVDNVDASRFEVRLEGEVAGYAEYRETPGTLAFTHTVVTPRYEGRGVGSALARGALDAARARGLTVLPYCRFIRGYIAKHPDYLALVPADGRAEFDLVL